MRVKEADLRRMRSDMFLMRNLDRPNRVELACEIRSWRSGFCGVFGSETVRPWAETLMICPRQVIGVQFVRNDRIDKKVECTVTAATSNRSSRSLSAARSESTSIVAVAAKQANFRRRSF
jgi:hypothetical protein